VKKGNTVKNAKKNRFYALLISTRLTCAVDGHHEDAEALGAHGLMLNALAMGPHQVFVPRMLGFCILGCSAGQVSGSVFSLRERGCKNLDT
jgi:hypothetical protein